MELSYSEVESYILRLLSEVKPVWLIVLTWSFFTSLIGFLTMAADKGRQSAVSGASPRSSC